MRTILFTKHASWDILYTTIPQNPHPNPRNHTIPTYNFIPNALCTLKLCLIDKSNIISSLPPGIA